MRNTTKKQVLNFIIPVATLVSGFGLGFLNYSQAEDKVRAAILARQEQFDESRRKEREDIIMRYMPDLVSGDAEKRLCAQAVVRAFFSEDSAEGATILSVAEDVGAPDGMPASNRPATVSFRSQEWGIILGSDDELKEEQEDSVKARKAGLRPVAIYKKGKLYYAVVTTISSRAQAQSQNFIARAKISEATRVVNLSDWAPSCETDNRGVRTVSNPPADRGTRPQLSMLGR